MQNDESGLKSFINELAGPLKRRVEEHLGEGYVRLHISEAEKRQAKHDIRWVEDIIIEALRNSRDAFAKNIFLATKKDSSGFRQVFVIDDGDGIPDRFKDKIFEPRVTSKLNSLSFDRYGVHGRGMALYSIKTNVSDARVVWSDKGKGTVFYCLADTNLLKERKDQSTFPLIRVEEGKRRVVSGPNNIIRVSTEFALNYPDIRLYYGSPPEILATMWHKSLAGDQTAPWSEMVQLSNHINLSEFASKRFNMQLSERNAHRIMQGDIPPIPPLIIRRKKIKPHLELTSVKSSGTKLGFQKHEIDQMVESVEKIIRPFARKYALRLICKPSANINNNQLSFKLYFQRSDYD